MCGSAEQFQQRLLQRYMHNAARDCHAALPKPVPCFRPSKHYQYSCDLREPFGIGY
jgi:hypothetical protein